MKTIKTTAFALLLGSAAAFAQTTPSTPSTTTPTPATTPDPTSTNPEPMARDIPDFRSLDTNGDGRLTKEEAATNAWLTAKFSEFDTDSNGSLSTSEYAKASASASKGKASKPRSMDPSSSTGTPEPIK